MNTPFNLTRRFGFAFLLCAGMLSSSAMAGDQTNAAAAIAVARGKIAAGDKVGANSRAPELQEQARAALIEAQQLLDNHHKKEAQAAAVHAGELADQALVSSDNRREQAEQTRRLDAQDATISAQQSAASANMRANSAEAMGNAANIRADAATQEAVSANARTDALRAMPSPQTASMTTTVEQDETAMPPAPLRHRAVRKPARKAAPIHHGKTVTVVTTSQH
ncbi:hypothetical protein FHW96_002630 [Novosphingobium sp. SG751A]|uniref:hypothetical protein n=1 Tax=Novosphingobium sp. SG751A TaxID=2587000 RepID=UPI001555C284|nr:hypothetical protein [Novosphingobium sp. SG751A]NOW46470.1 hypothetical protein [Novosphingobium sp. SG751A]